jgi:hypothetical protein
MQTLLSMVEPTGNVRGCHIRSSLPEDMREPYARSDPGYCEGHAGLEKQAFLIVIKRL